MQRELGSWMVARMTLTTLICEGCRKIPALVTSLLWAVPLAANQQIQFPDPRLPVFGLGWYAEDQPRLSRLPERLKPTVNAGVWGLAQQPSGGRVRFRTNSKGLSLRAENPAFSNMHHMASVGENGFDLYVDGQYRSSVWPDAQGKIQANWTLGSEALVRDVEIYLPLYKSVSIQEVSVDDGAKLLAPSPYRVVRPVVYYGSSITQGGCASNAGGTYQAILERRLNADFINLGFSGSGLGEIQLAQAINELDPSAIVLDFWANPSLELYRQNLPPFISKLRERFPQLPILVISPFYFPGEASNPKLAEQQRQKRTFARDLVRQRQGAGDAHVYWVDGLAMLSAKQTDGLVDGVHPNSLGFFHCANGLEGPLGRALGRAVNRR